MSPEPRKTPPHAAALGRRGGQETSDRKRAATRLTLAKARAAQPAKLAARSS